MGNPFLLLAIENQMVEKYGDDAVRCWSTYMRQCIECKTFEYSKELQNNFNQSVSDKLLHMIYNTSASKSLTISRHPDRILKAYQKVLQRSKEYNRARILIESRKGTLSWKIDKNGKKQENVRETENDSGDKYECILEVINYRKAKAIPLDNSKQVMMIHGMDNRKPAFDGDTVMVKVFEDGRFENECCGIVLNIIEESNRKFICRVSKNPIVFIPIDNKNPVFINLPPLSRDIMKNNEGHRGDLNLKVNDVVVFDLHDFDEGTTDCSLPQIKQVIPLSVAKNMLFVVAFVKWDNKYRNPLGIVEAVFPKGYTPFNAERILKFQHCIEYNDDEPHTDHKVEQSQESVVFSKAFTIDPEGAQNLDDALSIVKLHTDSDGNVTYELAVHIVNAAKHIQEGSENDKDAKSRGVSVYGGSKGKVMHMLPSYGLRSNISLTPGQVRDVISVIGTVDFNPTQPQAVNIQSVTIIPTQIKSSMQLTYKSAQQILEGSIPEQLSEAANSFTNITLCDSMKLLYDIALALRLRRMQSDAAYAYDVSDPGEEECWQTHLLVEELMIWANNEVAKKIHASYPNEALMRRQSPPNADKLTELISDNLPIILNSLSLSKYSNPDERVDPASIIIPNDILHKLVKALRGGDIKVFTYYLTTNKCYPQLAAVESELKSISLRAEYCCSEERNPDSSKYRHDALNLDKYTHFTSPMRRYFDIQVQRMLTESLQSTEGAFSHDEHHKLCLRLNAKMLNSKLFEKQVSQVALSFECLSSSKIYTAFIVSDKDKFIEFQFPHLNLKHFPKNSLKLKVSNISLSYKMTSFTSLGLADDESIQLVDLQPNPSATLNGRIKIVYVPEDSMGKNEDKYPTLSFKEYNFCFKKSGSEIPANLWQELLETIKSPSPSITSDQKKRLVQKLGTLQSQRSFIDPKTLEEKCLYLEYKLKDPWKSPNLVKVWLGWSMRDHIISPTIQMVEFSPHVRFCIQHCSRPAECYSDPNLSQASKQTYKNVYEYIDLWKKVLLAEAAKKSVLEKGCKPIVFCNVTIEWPDLVIPTTCFNEGYYVPKDMVKIVIPSHFVNSSEFLNINVGDFVCLRCQGEETRAVFHFVVHQKEEQEQEEELSIQIRHIGEYNCRISEEMKRQIERNNWTYEMQIIPMSVSFR